MNPEYTTTSGGAAMTREEHPSSLFNENQAQELRTRWNEVQTAFVDEPRSAVKQADELVSSTMKRLTDIFAEERSRLEQQWEHGDDASTEDLRLAFQRYRAFFNRLLSV